MHASLPLFVNNRDNIIDQADRVAGVPITVIMRETFHLIYYEKGVLYGYLVGLALEPVHFGAVLSQY